MEQSLTKQTSAQLTFAKAPAEFTKELLVRLIALQDATRTKIAETELDLWVQTLGAEGVSLGEIDQALEEYASNPPKQVLPNGEMQDWRGMPTLLEIKRIVCRIQGDKLEQTFWANLKREKEEREKRELEFAAYVKEHPEEYEPIGDLWKWLNEEYQKLKSAQKSEPLGPLPEEIKRTELRQQFKEHQEKQGK